MCVRDRERERERESACECECVFERETLPNLLFLQKSAKLSLLLNSNVGEYTLCKSCSNKFKALKILKNKDKLCNGFDQMGPIACLSPFPV